MKVVLGLDRLLPGYGIANVVLVTARGLIERGIDASVVCGTSQEGLDIPVVTCGFRTITNSSKISSIVRRARTLRPDIFHSHFFPADLCGAILKNEGIPHILHYHGVSFWQPDCLKILSDLRAWSGVLTGLLSASRIICVSRYLHRQVTRFSKSRGAEASVIYNPVCEPSVLGPLDEGTPVVEHRPTRSDSNSAVILSVGAFAPIKGQRHLLQMAQQLSMTRQRFKMVIAGRVGSVFGEYYRNLVNLARRYGLNDRVTFAPDPSTHEIWELYRQADVFVTATAWEGFGYPIAEAMTAGLPAVAYRTTAMPELIDDSKTGFLVETGNPIALSTRVAALLDDADLRKTMGRRARAVAADRYSPEKYIERIIAVYQAVLARQGEEKITPQE